MNLAFFIAVTSMVLANPIFAATKLAVFELSDGTPPTYLGAAISEVLAVGIGDVPGVTVLERTQRFRLQEELNLMHSSLTSRDKALRVAKHWQADYAFVGAIEHNGSEYKARVSLINMRDSKRTFEIRESAASGLDLQDKLYRQVIDFLSMSSRYDIFPASRIVATRSDAAFLKYGRGLSFAYEGLLERAEEELQEALAVDASFTQASTLLEKVRQALDQKRRYHTTGANAWHSVWFVGPATALLAGPTEYYEEVSTRSLYYALITGAISAVCLSGADDEEDGDTNLAWGIGTGLVSGAFLYNSFRARQIENDRNKVLSSFGQYDPFIQSGWALMLSFYSLPAAKSATADLAERMGIEDDDLGTAIGFSVMGLTTPTDAWKWGITVSSTDQDSIKWGETYIQRSWSLLRHKKDRFSPYFSASIGCSTLTVADLPEQWTYSLGAGVGVRYFLRSDVMFDCDLAYKYIPFDGIAGEVEEIEDDVDFGGMHAGLSVSIIFD